MTQSQKLLPLVPLMINTQIGGKNKKIAEQVLKSLQPISEKSIRTTLESILNDLIGQLNEVDNISASVQKSALLNHYDNDRLEQYTRRENIQILGNFKGNTSEELINEMRSLGQKVVIEITKDDIASCHKVGNGVICRFVNRGVKEEELKAYLPRQTKNFPE